MSRPTLYLMLGYPGAGKTTTAKLIHTITGAEHLWADQVRREMYQEPSYSHAENMHLYAHLNDMTNELLSQGKSVIFDTNFSFYHDREHLRTIATKHNARTLLVWVQADKKTAKQRATVEAHLHSHTRVLGNMSDEHFERIAKSLEPPHMNEDLIIVNGSKITENYIKESLNQAGIILEQ